MCTHALVVVCVFAQGLGPIQLRYYRQKLSSETQCDVSCWMRAVGCDMSDWHLTEEERGVLQRALEIVSSTPPEDSTSRSGARTGEGLAGAGDGRSALSSGGPSSRNGQDRFNPTVSRRSRSAVTPPRASSGWLEANTKW